MPTDGLRFATRLDAFAREGFDGTIPFDTRPDLTGLDPLREGETDFATIGRMPRMVDRLGQDDRLPDAVAPQDATSSQRIVREAMFGPGGVDRADG